MGDERDTVRVTTALKLENGRAVIDLTEVVVATVVRVLAEVMTDGASPDERRRLADAGARVLEVLHG